MKQIVKNGMNADLSNRGPLDGEAITGLGRSSGDERAVSPTNSQE